MDSEDRPAGQQRSQPECPGEAEDRHNPRQQVAQERETEHAGRHPQPQDAAEGHGKDAPCVPSRLGEAADDEEPEAQKDRIERLPQTAEDDLDQESEGDGRRRLVGARASYSRIIAGPAEASAVTPIDPAIT